MHLTTYRATGGLPGADDPVNETVSAPMPDDVVLVMTGADGSTVGMVTALDADEHASPPTPLLAMAKQ
jgi:hypothetical protein